MGRRRKRTPACVDQRHRTCRYVYGISDHGFRRCLCRCHSPELHEQLRSDLAARELFVDPAPVADLYDEALAAAAREASGPVLAQSAAKDLVVLADEPEPATPRAARRAGA